MEPGPPLHLAYLADPTSVHTQRWLGFFAARGHRVSLLVGMNDPADDSLDPRVEVHRYPRFGPRRVPFLSSLQGRGSLRRLLAQLRPDVLHAHYLSRYGWQARLSGFHPYVVTPWGSDLLVTPRRSLRARAWARATLRGADLVTAHSQQLREVAVAMGARPERIERVEFGVDTAALAPGEPDAERLAALGLHGRRLVFSPRAARPNYRQDLVIAALAHLPQDVAVVIPGRNGDASVLEQLQASAAALGAGERVHVLPDIEPTLMLDLYRAAAVVVSVPDSDGLPVTLLEAMACGTPAVASDLPGPREALGPEGSRFVVPRGDAAALADAVNAVLSMPAADREALGAALRARAVAEFDATRSMLRMESLYRGLGGTPA
jgi:glycosyltransferase involved in cell wall biosynthesis